MCTVMRGIYAEAAGCSDKAWGDASVLPAATAAGRQSHADPPLVRPSGVADCNQAQCKAQLKEMGDRLDEIQKGLKEAREELRGLQAQAGSQVMSHGEAGAISQGHIECRSSVDILSSSSISGASSDAVEGDTGITTVADLDPVVAEAAGKAKAAILSSLAKVIDEVGVSRHPELQLREEQSERICLAFNRIGVMSQTLLADAHRDVRFIVEQARRRLEPAERYRRISLPSITRHSEFRPAEAGEVQQAHHSRDGAVSVQGGRPSSPIIFDAARVSDDSRAPAGSSVGPSPLPLVAGSEGTDEVSGTMTSIPEGAALGGARRARPQIRGGHITSADLPPVFISSGSESSCTGSFKSVRIRPVFVPETQTQVQNESPVQPSATVSASASRPGPSSSPSSTCASCIDRLDDGGKSKQPNAAYSFDSREAALAWAARELEQDGRADGTNSVGDEGVSGLPATHDGLES